MARREEKTVSLTVRIPAGVLAHREFVAIVRKPGKTPGIFIAERKLAALAEIHN